jgi:hypothetical protein
MMETNFQILLVGLVILAGACTEVVTVQDLPAHVAFVGPMLVNEDGNVETFFGVVDAEGGSFPVEFQVCAGGACSTTLACPSSSSGDCLPELIPLPGSTTLDRVPAPRRGATAPQRVVWTPSCSDADSELTVRVGVVDSDVAPLTSRPFTLAEIGACQ